MDEKVNEVMSPLKDREKMDEELKMLADGIGRKIAGFKMTKSFANAWYNIRQKDKCCTLIDEIGLETICKHIWKYYLKWYPTRKTQWEYMFVEAIYEIKTENFCVKNGIGYDNI